MPGYDAHAFDPPAPVATVTLRHQERKTSLKDVLMLIDSGADVSLVPEWCVRQLALPADDRHNHELMAFDGSTRIAKSVQCDSFFLGRVYRGRYAVLDSSYGILGRDILNHVSFVFDGPQRNWREAPASK